MPKPEPDPEPTPEDGWIVALDGSPEGEGTADSPWSLPFAFSGANGRIQPGDTVYLRGGTYRHSSPADAELRASGTSESPITFRSYPGEWAVIDAAIVTHQSVSWWGSDVTVRDVELCNSAPERDGGMWGRSDTVYFKGPRSKLINCVLHDGQNACGFWAEAVDSEIYGCLIYNTGAYEGDNPDVSWGHSFYVQNLPGATKVIRDNVAINPFRNGLDIYSATEAGGAGITVEGNTIAWPGNGYRCYADAGAIGFNGTFSPGGAAEDFNFNANVCFVPSMHQSNWIVNGADFPHGRLSLCANEFIGGGPCTYWGHWDEGEVSGNRYVGEWYFVRYASAYPTSTLALHVDHNEFFFTGSYDNQQFNAQGQDFDFPGWQAATGADLNSTCTKGLPTDCRVFVRPNAYERGRAFVTVINHSPETRAVLPLDGLGLEPGEAWEVIDCQNWPGGAILSSTYEAGQVVFLPLDRTESVAPVGYDRLPLRDPRFNCFLVRRPR